MNVWKNKLIFPTDTTAKDRNNWLKTIILAAENTSALIILATTVFQKLFLCFKAVKQSPVTPV